MNRTIMNMNTLNALDNLSAVIRKEMNKKGFNAVTLAEKAGVDRKMIYPLLHEPYKAPNFGNLIAILDVLGLKEVTIKWK